MHRPASFALPHRPLQPRRRTGRAWPGCAALRRSDVSRCPRWPQQQRLRSRPALPRPARAALPSARWRGPPPRPCWQSHRGTRMYSPVPPSPSSTISACPVPDLAALRLISLRRRTLCSIDKREKGIKY
eukprot:scaffold259274_cov33-Tisochrysis_lutea.AAC.1